MEHFVPQHSHSNSAHLGLFNLGLAEIALLVFEHVTIVRVLLCLLAFARVHLRIKIEFNRAARIQRDRLG